MAKAYSVRGLCYYICYSAEDLATHFGVHIQTVREWVRKGLSPIDNNKPALFMGAAVIQFINALNDQRKIATAFNEFYCVSCHHAHTPGQNTIELKQDSGGFIRATGVCSKSGIRIHKCYKMEDLPQLRKKFTVVDTLRLYGSGNSTLNTHISHSPQQTDFMEQMTHEHA